MNIVRETLILEKKDELVTLFDKYDIRVIDKFIKMSQIPYEDEIRELLMYQFNEAICKEVAKVSGRYPELLDYGKEMIASLSTNEKIFNHELFGKFSAFLSKIVYTDLEAAYCAEKCIVYYTSFFLDELDEEDNGEDNEADNGESEEKDNGVDNEVDNGESEEKGNEVDNGEGDETKDVE